MKTELKKGNVLMVLVIAVGLLFVATSAFAEDHAVKAAKKDGIGSYLTDIKGMTLYYFKKDSAGKSVCAGSCVENWPIFYQEPAAVMSGLDLNNLGNFTRADGKKQSTYKGMPLYYFKGDKAAGDTKGQGIKDAWFVVAP